LKSFWSDTNGMKYGTWDEYLYYIRARVEFNKNKWLLTSIL
jgi:hypothetical protein